MEARYVWGEQALYDELKTPLRRPRSCAARAAQFVEAKLAERDARHQRVGDSRYQLEPNVKEGKGGLRDLHTLFWIAKYIYRIDDVAKLVELGVLSAEELARFAARPELSVDGALSPALPRRPRRGAADLRRCRPRSARVWATPTMPAAAASSAS